MTLSSTYTSILKLILLSSLWWVLHGCSNMSAQGNLLKATDVSQLTQWQASGKLAFITPSDKQSINFVWLQNDADYKVNFNTFLGINVLSIKRDINGIIISADGTDYQSDDPQQLVYELTGWWLPIDELSRWLKADIKANEGIISRNSEGYVESFTPSCRQTSCSDNVELSYSQFQSVERLTLPHRLTIQTQGLTQQTLKIRVQRWQ